MGSEVVNMTTHLHLVQRLRTVELYLNSSVVLPFTEWYGCSGISFTGTDLYLRYVNIKANLRREKSSGTRILLQGQFYVFCFSFIYYFKRSKTALHIEHVIHFVLMIFLCSGYTRKRTNQYRSPLHVRYAYVLKTCCTLLNPLWSSGQSSWLQMQGSRVRFPGSTKKSSGSGTGCTQPPEYNWGATW
jgi:hypothetical protein